MNHLHQQPSLAAKAFNVLLWTLQVLWGVFFSFTGFGKVLCYDPGVWSHQLHQVAWFSAVPQGLFVFIGACEGLGGIGLILPAMTGVKPKLTPFAAVGLTLIMILAAIFHIVRGEYSFFLPVNLVLGGIAAFIAYGRLMVVPIAARSINTFRLVTGFAVLGVLVFAGFVPVWYQITHTSSSQPVRAKLGVGNIMSKNGGIIGISDHGGWAVLMTVARDGTLLDRRRVELVGDGLPKLPHHSEGQRLPLDEAVKLVERVRVSAERHAVLALDAVTTAVPRIIGVALRKCPQLPPTIAERITDYHAQNNADWVMYREALASAAEARGWPVHWYDAKSVLGAARQALRVESLDAHFLKVRRALGPPWNNDHKLAMSAAIVTAPAAVE